MTLTNQGSLLSLALVLGCRAPAPSAQPAAPPKQQTVLASSPTISSPVAAGPQSGPQDGVVPPQDAIAQPAAVQCVGSRPRTPPEWRDIFVSFAKNSTRPTSSFDSTTSSRILMLLREHPDLALWIQGERLYPGERTSLIRPRLAAVRRQLLRLGVDPDQVLIDDGQPIGHVVVVSMRARPPAPVKPGEPCGTTVLRTSRATVVRDLAALGWWARKALSSDDNFRDVRTHRGTQLEPMQGSRLTPLVRRPGGYATVRWNPLLDAFEFTLLDIIGGPQQTRRLPGPASTGVDHLALVGHPGGFILAWVQGFDELHTAALDLSGDPVRASGPELLAGAPIDALTTDWRDGAGGIAYTLGNPSDPFGPLMYAAIDAQGHFQGAPRMLFDGVVAPGPLAMATLGPDRVSVLVVACPPFTMRIDVDARGDMVAVDEEFLRFPSWLGLGFVRGPNGVWAASIGESMVDLRPMCEVPGGSGTRAVIDKP
ncbi:MAG TPA: hypothetical protein VGB85_33360 [Nannocystis sp.]|jgi:hypothetical protein